MALSHMNYTGTNNDNQQRHMGYASTSSSITSGGNFRQAPRSSAAELTNKDSKSHHANRPKFADLKGRSWSAFTEAYGCESSDDDSDGDTTDDDPLIASTIKRRNTKGSVVKLKYKDRHIYGTCPETDAFQIVTCRICRMVLKLPSLKAHLDRHEKDKKHEHSSDSSPIKHERFEKLSSSAEKTISVTEKLDKISVVSEKYEKIPHMIIDDKLSDEKQRQRAFLKKPIAATATSTSSSSIMSESSMNTLKFEKLSSSMHDYSSNSAAPRRRKRKHDEVEKQQQQQPPTFPKATITSIQPNAGPCRTIAILDQPTFIPLAHTSSPPPLAPITSKSNDPHTSVVLKITMPTTVIDGSFLVQPLEQDEAEIDLKDLKILKPIVKDSMASVDHQTHLTSSNFFAGQPKPLAMNTFNLRKINAQRYVMSAQRKLVEFSKNLNLKSEEKVVTGKLATPKTWSFIERSQVFTIPNPIYTRITH